MSTRKKFSGIIKIKKETYYNTGDLVFDLERKGTLELFEKVNLI